MNLGAQAELLFAQDTLRARRVTRATAHTLTRARVACKRRRRRRGERSQGEARRPYLDGIKGGHGVNHQASRLWRGGKQKSKTNRVSAN